MLNILCLRLSLIFFSSIFFLPPPLSASRFFSPPPHPICLSPSIPSLTPYLSLQFHSYINQVQTIRLELVPVLPSTSWFMARNTPFSVSPSVSLPHSAVCVCVCGCLYARLCICLRHRTVNVSRGNNVINYKTL